MTEWQSLKTEAVSYDVASGTAADLFYALLIPPAVVLQFHLLPFINVRQKCYKDFIQLKD